MNVNNLLAKYARATNLDGVRVYCSKHSSK